MATSTYTSQGWSAQSSSSSPWNAGILLNVPSIMNRYPPGLSHGAWRSTSSRSASLPVSSDRGVVTGSKRPRPPAIRSGRRAPPPPLQSRVHHAPVAFPSENSYPNHPSSQNHLSSNLVIYKSPNHARTHLASQSQSYAAGHSYPFQPVDGLAEQRAAADKEARLRVVASILLNRVNLVGKPMRRRPRVVALDGPKTYVRSGLGRCVSVAE
jgi:hypothetical protein